MEEKKNRKQTLDMFHYNNEVNMRSILQNAIKMQALFKGKRINIIESSRLAN